MFFKSIETEIKFNLLVWGSCSIIGGATFIYFDNDFMKTLGFQFIIWGLIESIIAIGPSILRSIRKKPHIENLAKLKNILIINVFLDIVFVAVGSLIFVGIFEIYQYNGHGLGVIIQGAFLVIFNTYYTIIIIQKGQLWKRRKY